MGDFPYLEWMARLYKDKALRSGLDADYLKGHALANVCLSQDDSEERFELVYEIENHWYNGKHPSPTQDLEETTRDRKNTLAELRSRSMDELTELKPDEKTLDINNVLSGKHDEEMHTFSDNVFFVCQNLSDNVRKLLQVVIQSSLKSLGDAPCEFAVIEFGSVACGETSSFSDLKIGFLIENDKHRDYFVKLSVDLCFQIMNLGETSIEVLKIDELQNMKLDDKCAVSGLCVSDMFPKAFHIYTVEGIMKQCQDSLAFLSSLCTSEVVYPIARKEPDIYTRFIQQLDDEITRFRSDSTCRMKLFSDLGHHITHSRLVPEFKLHPYTKGVVPQINRDKMRFLVELLRKLQVLLHTRTCHSWDTLAQLLDLGIITKQDYSYLKIALGLSLFAIISTDLSKGKQAKLLSFNSEDDKPLVSCNISITLGYLLLSLYKSSLSYINSNPQWKLKMRVIVSFFKAPSFQPNIVIDAVKPLFNDLALGMASDFMLQVELLLFVKDYTAALSCLENALGEKALQTGEAFVGASSIRYDMEVTNPVIVKYCQMCFFTLFSCHKYTQSVQYVQWLILRDSRTVMSSLFSIGNATCSTSSLRPWTNFVIKCYELKVHHRGAKTIISELLNLIKIRLGIMENAPLLKLVEYLKAHKYTSQTMCSVVADLCEWYGSHCRYLHEFDDALQYYKASCSLNELLILDDKYGARFVYNDIGLTYSDMEDYTKAVEYFTKCLEVSESLFSDSNSVDIGSMCINIANTYAQSKEYTKALEYYARGINIQKTVCGENSIAVAESYHCLSHLYHEVAKYTKSLEYHFKSLDIHRVAVGVTSSEANADVARYYNCISDVYADMGNFAQSLRHKTMALDMTTTLHGVNSDHLEISREYNALAALYIKLGDYKTSMEYCRTSLAMIQRLYGSGTDHRHVAISYNFLSTVYLGLGEYAKSLEYLTMSLEMKQRLYGDANNHSDIAESYNHFGDLYQKKGEFTESLEWYLKSFNMKKLLLGDIDHPSIVVSIANIGYLYTLMGEYSKSFDFNQKYLNMVRSWTRVHPDVAKSYSNIGYLYLLMGLYSSALTYLTKSLEMYVEIYGKDCDHPSLASSYTHLGCVYSKTTKHAEALEYLTKALHIRKRLYGSDANHHLIAFAYRCLGETYTAMHDDTKDVQFHEKSMHMLKKLFSETHPEIAEAYRKMGQMYSAKCRYEESQQCHDKSLSIRLALYGANVNHPHLADNYHDLGNMYLNMGKHSENSVDCYTRAYDYYTKSLNMRKALFGAITNHPDIAEGYNQISSVCGLMGNQAESVENLNKSIEMTIAIKAKFVHNVNEE